MGGRFSTRLGFTREHQLHNSGPEADANQVRPGGRFGFGLVTGHPIGSLVVAAILIIVLAGLPEARLFFFGAVVLGALCGLVLWLRNR
jgi:hypothetical protein